MRCGCPIHSYGFIQAVAKACVSQLGAPSSHILSFLQSRCQPPVPTSHCSVTANLLR